uniref:PIN domain-containing protein n=1 Tax=Hippocampus comes TaxID=109280 RepID=A0A3Q2Z3Q4_HIPCM
RECTSHVEEESRQIKKAVYKRCAREETGKRQVIQAYVAHSKPKSTSLSIHPDYPQKVESNTVKDKVTSGGKIKERCPSRSQNIKNSDTDGWKEEKDSKYSLDEKAHHMSPPRLKKQQTSPSDVSEERWKHRQYLPKSKDKELHKNRNESKTIKTKEQIQTSLHSKYSIRAKQREIIKETCQESQELLVKEKESRDPKTSTDFTEQFSLSTKAKVSFEFAKSSFSRPKIPSPVLSSFKIPKKVKPELVEVNTSDKCDVPSTSRTATCTTERTVRKIETLGLPIVLIPWVVLQELDSLKKRKGLTDSVAHLACPAISYIYNSLKRRESHLWGQSMQQAAASNNSLMAENNDDKVLQCCLQYQSLYPGCALILCTNDKNLCSKAVLSGVKALSKLDLEEEVEGSGCTVNHLRSTVLQRLPQIDTPMPLPMPRRSSTPIIYIKPPWNLLDILHCLKRHWRAVFGFIVPRSLLQTVLNLIDFFKQVNKLSRSNVLIKPESAVCDVVMNEDDEAKRPPSSHVPHHEVWAMFENIWCKLPCLAFNAQAFSIWMNGFAKYKSNYKMLLICNLQCCLCSALQVEGQK